MVFTSTCGLSLFLAGNFELHLKMSVELCRVCGTTAHGAHFGVYSCRACAAFFRRSLGCKIPHPCRFRNYKCNIDSSESLAFLQYPLARSGLLCRACRLRKCLKVGMEYGCESAQCQENVSVKGQHAEAPAPIVQASETTVNVASRPIKHTLDEIFSEVGY